MRHKEVINKDDIMKKIRNMWDLRKPPQHSNEHDKKKIYSV